VPICALALLLALAVPLGDADPRERSGGWRDTAGSTATGRGGPAPAPPEVERTILIAAAANLRVALEELSRAFRAARPGVEVRVTLGASGSLYAQIANGAPVDLFLSADALAPARIEAAGLALPGSLFTYALGRLVVWVPRGSGLDLERRGLAALLDPSVRKVAIANPSLAPYGRAAEAALRQAGLSEALAGKLVLGESVAQAAQFAESGNAQAALLPLALALAPPLSTEGRSWEVPASAHPRIEQAGVIPRSARSPGLAREFAAFLRGSAGRAILERSGYALPD
jgi:molybdate transport system substrate-binding protein